MNELEAAADAGSLFDLKKDSVASIAKVIVGTVTASRAADLAKEIMKLLATKPPRAPTPKTKAKEYERWAKWFYLGKDWKLKCVTATHTRWKNESLGILRPEPASGASAKPPHLTDCTIFQRQPSSSTSPLKKSAPLSMTAR